MKYFIPEELLNDSSFKLDGDNDPRNLYLVTQRQSYCYFCDADVEFRIEESMIETEIMDVVFSYLAKIAYCNVCGEEIYICELSDDNVRAANKKYRESKDKLV